VQNRKKLKRKKTDAQKEVTVKVWGIHAVSPEEKKEGYGWKDLQKRRVLSLE